MCGGGGSGVQGCRVVVTTSAWDSMPNQPCFFTTQQSPQTFTQAPAQRRQRLLLIHARRHPVCAANTASSCGTCQETLCVDGESEEGGTEGER